MGIPYKDIGQLDDSVFVLAVVQQNGMALESLAMESCVWNFKTGIVTAWNLEIHDRKRACSRSNCSETFWRYASDRLRQDRRTVLAACTQDGCALQFASVDLKVTGFSDE